MKVSYSLATGRASPHCITWTHRKKRYRKYFRSRIDAVRFRNEKEQELGIRSSHEIENEIIFLALSEIKDRLDSIDQRIEGIEQTVRAQEGHLKDLRKNLKKMHLAVTEELILPDPDEVKTLMNKMDELLKLIDSK